MLLAVHYQVMEHLGSLKSTQEASFVLSKLPACSITRKCTLKHDTIVKEHIYLQILFPIEAHQKTIYKRKVTCFKTTTNSIFQWDYNFIKQPIYQHSFGLQRSKVTTKAKCKQRNKKHRNSWLSQFNQ